jgi:hypothetical protein
MKDEVERWISADVPTCGFFFILPPSSFRLHPSSFILCLPGLTHS